MSSLSVRSGDAVFSFGDDLVVLTWNEAAERLTGIPAEEAIGTPCWSVLRARTPRGDLLCHAGCSNARLAREGWCVDCQAMALRDAAGDPLQVQTSTIRVEQDGRRVYLHVLRETAEAAPAADDTEPAQEPDPAERAPELTTRQLEILRLVDGGRGARAIAAELRLAESTVRNHIRGILVAFGAHSQLEALAKARRCGLLRHA
jgi:DNA-binding CsgD family transcriptional regulator